MFKGASKFNQQICGWTVEGEDMFDGSLGGALGIKIILTNENKDDKLLENASNKNIVKCFDTSEVTNMDSFLMESNINADLSSWDVSSVTSMNVSFHFRKTFMFNIVYFSIKYLYLSLYIITFYSRCFMKNEI